MNHPRPLATVTGALVLVASASFSPSIRAQSTWYVDGSCGDDSWSGASPACGAPDGPKRTIQAGMDAAGAGDLVLVADGVYAGEGNKGLSFPYPRWSMLRSTGGPESCIIDLQGTGMAFFFVLDEGPEALVEGFTIRNGADSPAGGIYFHHASRVTVYDCVFEDNVNHYGAGAIYVDNDASPTILGCRFTGNVSLGGGGAIGFAGSSASTPRVVNCTFTDNTATEGGAVYFAGFEDSPALINCTIAGNEAEEGGALYLGAFSNPRVANSIVWGNDGGAIAGEGEIDVMFSDVEGGWPGVGNIDADPLFESLSVPRLSRLSPCIDAGDNFSVPSDVFLDLAGRPRIWDGDLDEIAVVDLGAFEFVPRIRLMR